MMLRAGRIIQTTILGAALAFAANARVRAEANAASDATHALVDNVFKHAGINAGVVVLPRAGDGTLAAALARRGVKIVYAMEPDEKAVVEARKPAETDKTLGWQVIVEEGKPAAIPLADRVADLVLVTDATDANLSELPAAEMGRIVAAYRGEVVVGQPKNGTGGLTQAALAVWAKGVGGDVKITADESGLWAVVRMPDLNGGDDWTHYEHDADGNPVSNDKAFVSGPCALQWYAKPYYEAMWDVHVVSAGRMFSVQTFGDWLNGHSYELVARSYYNSAVLWRRFIHENVGQSASILIATPNQVFVKDGGGAQALEPETGAEIRRFEATNDNDSTVVWMLYSDNILLTLVGPKQELPKRDDTKVKFDLLGTMNEVFTGREIKAWDTVTGKELWKFEAERIDPSKLVVKSGRVFLYAGLKYAACLDLKSGAQIWKTDDPMPEPKGAGMGVLDVFGVEKDFNIFRSGAIATNSAYLISYKQHRHSQAFAAADGRMLWEKAKGGPSPAAPIGNPSETARFYLSSLFDRPVVIDSTIFENRLSERQTNAFDLTTLKPKDGNGFGAENCGRFTGSTSGLLIGAGGGVFDIKQKRYVLNDDAKSACGTAQFIADGLLLKVPGACPSCSEWRGGLAVCNFSRPDDPPEDRLRKGNAEIPQPQPVDSSDWPTYRSTNERCGSSSALVPPKVLVRWTFEPRKPLKFGSDYLDPDTTTSPAISVGDRIWMGTSSGAIVCLDRKSGLEQWRYWTGGRVFAVPTWWEGKLYAGSCDGYVYCLNAESGGLLWRYRVAPLERRVMAWGFLESAWPVQANVLVNNGVVYAAAGWIPAVGGSVLCALDANTGKSFWSKHYSVEDGVPKHVPLSRKGGKSQVIGIEGAIDTGAPGAAPAALYRRALLIIAPLTYGIGELKPNAPYTVRLHAIEFADVPPGKRLIDVSVNGKVLLSGFDIRAMAGAIKKAVVQDLQAQTDDKGTLEIRISATDPKSGNCPTLSGIEILNGKDPVVRFVTGGNSIPGTDFLADPGMPAPSAKPVPGANGQLAWQDGVLWWKAGEFGPVTVNPSNGEYEQQIDRSRILAAAPALFFNSNFLPTSRGQDIGILPGGWVAFGGRQFILPPSTPIQPRNAYCLLRREPAGGAKDTPPVSLVRPEIDSENSEIPVWDAKAIFAKTFEKSAQSWWFTNMPQTLAGVADAKPTSGQFVRTFGAETSVPGVARPALPAELQRGRLLTFSPVLAANAVVVAVTTDFSDWNLFAVDRTTNGILWKIPLPTEPVAGTMSLTRNGDVLAPLIDGRVLCIGAETEGVRPNDAADATSVGQTQPGLLEEHIQLDRYPPTTVKTDVVGTFPIKAGKQATAYRLRLTGWIDIPTPGKYRFLTNLAMKTAFIVDGYFIQPQQWNTHGEVTLAAGKHRIEICVPVISGDVSLDLRWSAPDGTTGPVPASAFSHTTAGGTNGKPSTK